MKIGLMLPTFTGDGALAISAARDAERRGIAGVFVYDHLWPMGQPGRPALWCFAVLGAVAGATDGIRLGSLVARIGIRPNADLLASFGTLAAIAGKQRVIAALGASDHLSAAENEAYGIPHRPLEERLELLRDAAERTRSEGIETWIGGTSTVVADLARDHADALNLWAVTPDELAARAAAGRRTWGGQVLIGRNERQIDQLRSDYGTRDRLITGTVDQVAVALEQIAASGADWCVCAPLDYLRSTDQAIETLGLVAEAVQ